MDSSLRKMSKQRGYIYIRKEADAIFTSIARGVAHLHHHEFIHADLSDGNVLIRGNMAVNGMMEVKISDFRHTHIFFSGLNGEWAGSKQR